MTGMQRVDFKFIRRIFNKYSPPTERHFSSGVAPSRYGPILSRTKVPLEFSIVTLVGGTGKNIYSVRKYDDGHL